MLGLLLIVSPQISRAEEELILVVEVSRHGNRSPGKIYNYTVVKAENFNDTQELTPKGKL